MGMKGTMAYDKIPRKILIIRAKTNTQWENEFEIKAWGIKGNSNKIQLLYKIQDTKLILMSLLIDPLLYTIPLLSFIPQWKRWVQMPFRSVSCPLEQGSVMALRKYRILKGCDMKQL